MKKKTAAILLTAAMVMALCSGCQSSGGGDTGSSSGASSGSVTGTEGSSTAEDDAGGTDAFGGEISVISREEGSGTRGAFVELFGVETEDEEGNSYDNTTVDAQVTNNTAVMMSTVAGNPYAIGYVSLGSLDDSTRALAIDGAEASAEHVEDGSYKVSRPFNIVTGQELSADAQDFIDFILSTEGQQVVADNGYIPLTDTESYSGSCGGEKVTVAGSSSVTPLMEKLKEAYEELNENAEIEVQQNDSTTGVTYAIEGRCDIGMASRELKDSEADSGVTATVIATDGIAVIVNKENPVTELSSDQVRQIFSGEITDWNEVQ